jgi:hypothetical protein
MLPKFGGFEAQSKQGEIKPRWILGVNASKRGVQFLHRGGVVCAAL